MKLIDGITITKTEFDDVIHKILQRSEYRHLKNSLMDFIEGLRERVMEWLYKIFSKKFQNVGVSRAISKNISTIFIIIGLLIILGIIVLIIIKVRKGMDKKSKVKEILGEKIDDKTTPESLRNKARVYLEKEDYRGAIRYDFIALLLLMHEKNIIYLDETKTNKEICNYLKKSGFPNIGIFQHMVNIFNSSWYGHKQHGSEVYTKWGDNLELLWNEVNNDEKKN